MTQAVEIRATNGAYGYLDGLFPQRRASIGIQSIDSTVSVREIEKAFEGDGDDLDTLVIATPTGERVAIYGDELDQVGRFWSLPQVGEKIQVAVDGQMISGTVIVSDDEWNEQIYTPLAGALIGGILGGVLAGLDLMDASIIADATAFGLRDDPGYSTLRNRVEEKLIDRAMLRNRNALQYGAIAGLAIGIAIALFGPERATLRPLQRT